MTHIRVLQIGPTKEPDRRSRATDTPLTLDGLLHEHVEPYQLGREWERRFPDRFPLRILPPESNTNTRLTIHAVGYEPVDEEQMRADLDAILESLSSEHDSTPAHSSSGGAVGMPCHPT